MEEDVEGDVGGFFRRFLVGVMSGGRISDDDGVDYDRAAEDAQKLYDAGKGEGKQAEKETRPDTRHKMRLVCVLFTFENNRGRTDGRTDRRTDGRTQPHIEMRRRI